MREQLARVVAVQESMEGLLSKAQHDNLEKHSFALKKLEEVAASFRAQVEALQRERSEDLA